MNQKSWLLNLSLLKTHPAYRAVFIARFISILSLGLLGVAVPVQIQTMTHSSWLVGLSVTLTGGAMFIGLMVGGVLADRYERKKLILLARGTCGVGFIGLCLNAMLPEPSLLAIYALGLWDGFFASLGVTALLAATPAGDTPQAWLLADRRALRRYGLGHARPFPFSPTAWLRTGYLRRGNTLAKLAKRCAIDTDALAETVARFNHFASTGEDIDFHRGASAYNRAQGDHQVTLGPLREGPFYAVRILPGSLGTFSGLQTDEHARVLDGQQQPIPGLFAIGECASVGIHGANRLGSNSLTELLVFGKVAGDQAVKKAKSLPPGNSASLLKQAQAAEARVMALKTKTGGTERIADIRKEMVKTMEDGCGIYRVEETMQATCNKLAELRERFKNISIDDKSSVWNTDWLMAVELDYQLDVAQSMAHSAVNRKESRGAHQRLDGPNEAYVQRDDVNFLKHSEAYYVPGSAPRIAYGDVKITKSQPAARVYGAAGEKADQERKESHV